ncbi:TPA: SH3 domain-containing protein [Elizabethkingia anophelis]|uniref:SH3 domain-containing protein n=1 Tax=Elizabethkingia anophelis TaxID=1117645 RepID=UPI0016294010|nr:SH3 domain-containing protein [Elizabethkingia anophelis]MCT3674663.1 SH3 domain-containing protein [Elizabethkingia anophelis]MCT3682146.1 SH3 domain-containing protein [Elizabethkingia anophelis]MCT3704029.1 SH3 domain-containing protein [Elizabethkingia anophelis]MCT3771293.1 SH3 domain-containing protein [Elizabethkingia anophelis]MCT3781413.1 SH3 domain-containing protein [Elizabethkingia anophelis]
MRKVILSVILIIAVSCENKIVQESKTTVDTISANQLKTAQNYQNINGHPKSTSSNKYSFVVFVGEDFVSRNEKTVVTGIFETDPFLNQDDEYKLIDQAQRKNMINVELRNMQKRYLRSFNTYTEASQERERLLGINQDNRYVNNPRENYPVNRMDTAASPYYTVIESRAYFYKSPNRNSRKNSYLLYGAKIQVTEEANDFVYTIFTNTEGVTSRGWVLKSQLSAY